MTDNIALLNHDLLDQRLYQLRNQAVRDTLAYLKLGAPDHALQHITNSVLGEQARCAGIRVLPPGPA